MEISWAERVAGGWLDIVVVVVGLGSGKVLCIRVRMEMSVKTVRMRKSTLRVNGMEDWVSVSEVGRGVCLIVSWLFCCFVVMYFLFQIKTGNGFEPGKCVHYDGRSSKVYDVMSPLWLVGWIH